MQSRINPIQSLMMKMLTQPKFAWAVILPLSIFDMTAWLSLSMLCLLILRQGFKPHSHLVTACFVLHATYLYSLAPNSVSIIKAITDFWPSLIGAMSLLYFRSWTISAASMMGFLFVVFLSLDVFAPGFGAEQFKLITALAQNMSAQMNLSVQTIRQMFEHHIDVFTALMIGAQMMSAVFNAIICLTMARSLQAQIFNPGGFLKEMLGLRGNQYLLIGLILLLLAPSIMGWFWPLYLIPSLLLYFFCVGLSVAVCALAKNRIQIVFLVLVMASVLLPYVFVPLYVLAGVLDSFINFRVLLARRIKYTF
jgi:hypothetical protein